MLQEKHWNYLVDQLTYLQQMAELNQRLLQVTARQGKLQLIGGYVRGRNSKGIPFLILYSPSQYMDHKICRVYREQFKTLPDYIDTNVPAEAPEDNPTKSAAEKQGIYKPCKFFTIATYEGKDTQMGKEIRYMITVYVGKPPEPKGGMFIADLIQNRSLQASAPEWPQDEEPYETPEEYEQRRREETAIIDANHKEANSEIYVTGTRIETQEEHDLRHKEEAAIEDALTAQREAAEERVEQLNKTDYPIPGGYPTAEEEGQFIEDTVGDSYDEVIDLEAEGIEIRKPDTPEHTTYLAELNKEKEGVTLSQAKEIQIKHDRLDQEDYEKGVYEGEEEPPEQTDIQKNTTEFIQDHMEHLPPAIRQELLNQQLFPQHDIDTKQERPYKYKDDEMLSDSPFVNGLYDVYYEVHNKIPPSAKALQLWYVSDGMKVWLAETHNVEWIDQAYDDEMLLKEQESHEKAK